MIKLVRVTEKDSDSLAYIRSVYEYSFPADERRNFDKVEELLKKDNAFRLALIEKDRMPVGLFAYWQWADWRYVEHFAVDRICRGGGIGAEILQSFIRMTDTPVVLEVEHPDNDICIRRIRFYERQGFVLHPEFDYVQPPYDVTKNSLPLYLMTYKMPDFSNCCFEIEKRLHTQVYGVKV